MSPPRTPLQQLSYHQNAGQSSSPHMPSSPLNPYSKGHHHSSRQPQPTQQARRTSHKSKRLDFNAYSSPEPTQKALLRDRLKAKCVERAKKDRSKAVKMLDCRAGSSASRLPGSSDYDGSSDMEMEDDDQDDVDDVLFLRVIVADMRRQKHHAEYSYQRDVGSSIDPDMENMEPWEVKPGQYSQPTPEYDMEPDDDELQAQYEAYLEQAEDQPTGMGTESNVAAVLSSPVTQACRNDFLNHSLCSSCPQCKNASLQVSRAINDAIHCPACERVFQLADTATSWASHHSQEDSSHTPLWCIEPDVTEDQVLFLCSYAGCEWDYLL